MEAKVLKIRVVIYEQPFEATFVTISFLSLFIGQKQWKEKKEERKKKCEYE